MAHVGVRQDDPIHRGGGGPGLHGRVGQQYLLVGPDVGTGVDQQGPAVVSDDGDRRRETAPDSAGPGRDVETAPAPELRKPAVLGRSEDHQRPHPAEATGQALRDSEP